MVFFKKIINFFTACASFIGIQFAPEIPNTIQSPTFLAHCYDNYSLEQFHDYAGASILPMGYLTISAGRDLYIILGREFYGKDKGMYDDWGGARNNNEFNPLETAAREMSEEAISSSTMHLSTGQLKEYIGLPQKNTKHILVEWFVRRRSTTIRPYITCITEFDQHYLDRLIDIFYKARKWSFQTKYLEKDRIALVSYNNFLQAIKNHQPGVSTVVTAHVVDPYTLDFEKRTITLRPFLVKRMRNFALGNKAVHGVDKRIRIYQTNF